MTSDNSETPIVGGSQLDHDGKVGECENCGEHTSGAKCNTCESPLCDECKSDEEHGGLCSDCFESD